MPAYPQASFRFRPDDLAVFQSLQVHTGLGKADVVRIALRELARSYGLPVPAENEEKPAKKTLKKI